MHAQCLWGGFYFGYIRCLQVPSRHAGEFGWISKYSSCCYFYANQVFHEGLKSWSCCKDINKPELDFEEFMKISVRPSFGIHYVFMF